MNDTPSMISDAIRDIVTIPPQPTPPSELRTLTAGRRSFMVGCLPTGDGSWTYTEIDTTEDEEEMERPLHPRGQLLATDLGSFTQLLRKHATPHAEVYANEREGLITAVLDAGATWEDPQETRASWYDHQVSWVLRPDRDWLAWLQMDAYQFVSTSAMADHLETYRHTIMEPDAATILEVVQSIEVRSDVKFRVGPRSEGHRSFLVVGEDTVSAGHDKALTVPTELKLRLRPWIGGGYEQVTALFRYRIHQGELKLGIKLLRVDDVRERAWKQVVDDINYVLDSWEDDQRVATILVVNGSAPAERR